MIEIAPKSIDELPIKYPHRQRGSSTRQLLALEEDLKKLRPYQKNAINEWQKAGYRGILEMATATGKTLVAIVGAFELAQEERRLVTLVLVPNKWLVEQWYQNLKRYTNNVVKVSSDHDWTWVLDSQIRAMDLRDDSALFVVSTNASFQKKAFQDIANEIHNSKILLVGDEVHWLGADEISRVLETMDLKYDFSLGLSATPARYFDDEGTQELIAHIGPILKDATVDMKDAIQKWGVLTRYNYHLQLCDLTNEEFNDYVRLSVAISIAAEKGDREKVEALSQKRARIVKNAQLKLPAFQNLVSELSASNKIRYALVYCSENQIRQVEETLRHQGVVAGTFVEDTPSYERKSLIDGITRGMLDAIVSIHCLDEGVDVRPLRTGFFLSNSGNPKEFVQRRGRLLRLSEGKKTVDIYDFVVLPTIRDKDDIGVVKKIFEKELIRIREFNDLAENRYSNHSRLLEAEKRIYGAKGHDYKEPDK
jgi:superfamily II DNA or RNA helicase